MSLLLIYALAVVIGFVSYYFAVGLDSMMDWGSIFGNFRYRKFIKYALTHKDLITISTLIHSMEANEGEFKVTTRANYMNAIYWELVSWEPKFKLWVCVECMSTRIAAYLNLLMIISIFLFISHNWFIFLNIPFAFMVTIAIIHFNIRNSG